MIPTTHRLFLLVGVLAASISLVASDTERARPDETAPPERRSSAGAADYLVGAHYYPWYSRPDDKDPGKPETTKKVARGWMVKSAPRTTRAASDAQARRVR